MVPIGPADGLDASNPIIKKPYFEMIRNKHRSEVKSRNKMSYILTRLSTHLKLFICITKLFNKFNLKDKVNLNLT